jgi:hypothetical protein
MPAVVSTPAGTRTRWDPRFVRAAAVGREAWRGCVLRGIDGHTRPHTQQLAMALFVLLFGSAEETGQEAGTI